MSNFQVGQVVEVKLDPTEGGEINKTRPCLVIESNGHFDLVIILPITDGSGKISPIYIPIEDIKSAGLKKSSVIDTYQIRAISNKRIKNILGKVTKTELFKVKKNLARILEIDDIHL